MLKAYLSYAEAISSGGLDSARAILDLSRRHSADSSPSGPIDVATASGPSPLAEVVADFLAGLGLQPVHLDGRDAFRFDIGIVHPKTGLYHLAVECDPPHHPDLNDARARDLWRPRVLGQTVGRLVKIRSRDWLHDPEAEKQRLREAVAALL